MAKAGAKDKPKVIVIKKKGGGHGHHGGAWKVAYADFVTAMMALFMVLWLLSQTDENTRAELAHYFRSGVFSGSGHVIGDAVPSGHGPTVGGGSPRLGEQSRLEGAATQIEQALDLAVLADPRLAELREQIDVRVQEDGLLIQISDGGDDLLFGLASAELTPTLRQFLESLGPILGSIANELQIHGHTDARPFPVGSDYDNWDLSFRRAEEARHFLEGHGVRDGQIRAVVAHADSDLLYPDAPLDPRNRRLSILAVRLGHEQVSARGAIPVEGDDLAQVRAAAETDAGTDGDASAPPAPEPTPASEPADEEHDDE